MTDYLPIARAVLSGDTDPLTLDDFTLTVVAHIFEDDECCLPPAGVVDDEMHRRGLSWEDVRLCALHANPLVSPDYCDKCLIGKKED